LAPLFHVKIVKNYLYLIDLTCTIGCNICVDGLTNCCRLYLLSCCTGARYGKKSQKKLSSVVRVELIEEQRVKPRHLQPDRMVMPTPCAASLVS
jgi:CxxC motif-containing protein